MRAGRSPEVVAVDGCRPGRPTPFASRVLGAAFRHLADGSAPEALLSRFATGKPRGHPMCEEALAPCRSRSRLESEWNSPPLGSAEKYPRPPRGSLTRSGPMVAQPAAETSAHTAVRACVIPPHWSLPERSAVHITSVDASGQRARGPAHGRRSELRRAGVSSGRLRPLPAPDRLLARTLGKGRLRVEARPDPGESEMS